LKLTILFVKFPPRWAISIFQWSCLSRLLLRGKEKLSDYEILTDDRQMIGHCIHRLMWKYNGVNLMFTAAVKNEWTCWTREYMIAEPRSRNLNR
jgi:hypothetical protein